MRRQVVIAEQAERQIRTVDRWWRESRLAAPDLFAQELAAALDTISTHRGVGRRYPHRRVGGVRRTLLRAGRYHVYFVATDHEVVVLAVDELFDIMEYDAEPERCTSASEILGHVISVELPYEATADVVARREAVAALRSWVDARREKLRFDLRTGRLVSD